MIKSISIIITLLSSMLASFGVFAVDSPQIEVNISAESIPRATLYYKSHPVSDGEILFPLTISGDSQHFEKTSTFFYMVGNVPGAEVIFTEQDFILYASSGGNHTIDLTGDFIFQDKTSNASQLLSIPVIKNILYANTSNGFKVRFKSKSLAGDYSQGSYANSFTLLVKPTL